MFSTCAYLQLYALFLKSICINMNFTDSIHFIHGMLVVTTHISVMKKMTKCCLGFMSLSKWHCKAFYLNTSTAVYLLICCMCFIFVMAYITNEHHTRNFSELKYWTIWVWILSLLLWRSYSSHGLFKRQYIVYVKYRVGEESPYHSTKPAELDISFNDIFTHYTFINGVTACVSHSHNSAYFPLKLRSLKILKTWTSWHFVLFM